MIKYSQIKRSVSKLDVAAKKQKQQKQRRLQPDLIGGRRKRRTYPSGAFLLQTILTATFVPVLAFVANFTLAYAPTPTVLPRTYPALSRGSMCGCFCFAGGRGPSIRLLSADCFGMGVFTVLIGGIKGEGGGGGGGGSCCSGCAVCG